MENFTLTENHIKLIKRFNLDWGDGYLGAPCVDQKRPYGNKYVANDIAEILGIKDPKDSDFELSERMEKELLDLHSETLTALQIILTTGKFEPGDYVKTNIYDYRSWKKIND